MHASEELARKYFAARGIDMTYLKRSLELLITDEFLWQAPGYPDVHGRAGMVDLIDQQASSTGYARSEIEILRLAVGDGFVLTERVDTMLNVDGAVLGSVALMGRLDIRGGRICAHRDYFDSAQHVIG